MTTEKQLQAEIFKKLGGRRDVRLFRNNVGTAWMGQVRIVRNPCAVSLQPGDIVIRNGRRVKFGLHTGSGDLIGWRQLVITPAMVGRKIAQFLSLEVKTPIGRVTEDQDRWEGVVNASGGQADIVRSVADAVRAVEEG